MALQIIEMLIPKSNTFTRPGIIRTPKSITIHETANTSVRANALAHAKLQFNGNRRQASWHYTVDDEPEVYQSLPDNEVAYHAGNRKGNLESIGIEICVNQDGDYLKAVSNTIKLVRYLIEKHDSIKNVDVLQHHYWSGKDCPKYLRSGMKGINWGAFIEGVRSSKGEVEKPEKEPIYEQSSGQYKIGQKVLLKNSAKTYATGENIPSRFKGEEYTVLQRGSNRILLKELYSWVFTKDIEAVGTEKKEQNKISSSYQGNSIVDYLVSIGVDHSQANRERLAKEYGIKNYDFSAEKNLELLNAIRDGKKPSQSKPKPSSIGSTTFKVGDTVKIKASARTYATGESIPSRYKNKPYTIQQVKSDRVLIKELYSWVRKSDLVGGSSSSSKTSQKPSFKVGNKVTLKNTAKTYATGEKIPSRYKGKRYTIQQVKSDRVLLKELYSWVKKTDLQ